jgi:hypothetical protein
MLDEIIRKVITNESLELSIRNLTQWCALLITVQKATPLMLMYMTVINLYTTYKTLIVKSFTKTMRNPDVISDIFNAYTVSTYVASFSQK